MEFSQQESQSSVATTIIESTPAEHCSPSVEIPNGTVYFSSDSSYFQDFSAYQKQKFPQSFQDPNFQQSFQDPHFRNESNTKEQVFSTSFLVPEFQNNFPQVLRENKQSTFYRVFWNSYRLRRKKKSIKAHTFNLGSAHNEQILSNTF